jgi:hypothetical protein
VTANASNKSEVGVLESDLELFITQVAVKSAVELLRVAFPRSQDLIGGTENQADTHHLNLANCEISKERK